MALIPARAGSKSIPNKNSKIFCGKPLIQWSVLAAINCQLIDEVYVATDGIAIKKSLEKIKNKKLKVIGRSLKTATDSAQTESVMLEFSELYKFEIIILIQPTSPHITDVDLTNAIKNYLKNDATSLLSVVRQKRFIWKSNGGYVKPYNYDPNSRPLRQNFKGFMVENGAFYITKKSALDKTKCRISGQIIAHEMPERSYYEIDEESDWIISESLMSRTTPNALKVKSSIKLFVTDVDGVLTDSGMYYYQDGNESKKFNTRDGKGIELLRKKKIKTAIITSERTKIVSNRGKKLKIDYIEQGVKNKLEKLTEICKKENISLKQVAFIGDDINDTEVLREVGFSGVPSNAHSRNLNIADYICKAKGGHGCVREFSELIIDNLQK